MKNPFRTRAKYELFGRQDKYYIVKYRKWWQLRWHTLTSGGVYFWLGNEREAMGIVENINNGTAKI